MTFDWMKLEILFQDIVLKSAAAIPQVVVPLEEW